jgi:hypothetical protein
MSRNLDPSDPDFDDSEYPQPLPYSGLCYCERCHVQGADWSFRGKDYHADCAGVVMGISNEAAL